MHKLLQKDSKLVQQGSVSSNVAFTTGNLMAGNEHPVMAYCFLTGNSVGLAFGQTQTGVVVENGFVFAGYTALAVEGVLKKDAGKVFSGLLGMACATRYILDNFDKSVFYDLKQKAVGFLWKDKLDEENDPKNKNGFTDKLDEVLSLPAKGVQLYAQHLQEKDDPKKVQLGEDIEEISNRSMFKGASITLLSDIGFAASAIARLDVKDMAISFCWVSGTLLSAVSIPKDGNKNVFQQWAENFGDKIKNIASPKKNHGPNNP